MRNSLNISTTVQSSTPLETFKYVSHDALRPKSDSLISGTLVSINQSSQSYEAASDVKTAPSSLVISDGNKLSKAAISELLSSSTNNIPAHVQERLANIAQWINETNEDAFFNQSEKKHLLKDLYQLRRDIQGAKKNDVAKAIRHLEKLIYSSLLADKLNNSSQHYLREINTFSNPGATQSKQTSVGLNINCGVSIADSIASVKGSGNVGYTRTYTTDTDDEGIVGWAKEDKYQVTLGAKVNVGCTDEISLQAGGEIAAIKTVAKGVNFGGGATDYFREKFTHKLFSYKKNGIKDMLLTRKHSMLHHQRLAQNSQPLLEQSWSALIGKKVESISPAPFQADVTPKRINGLGYTANVNASAQFSSLANAGAKLQYDFAKNDIEVDILQNMFLHITSGNGSSAHLTNLDTLSKSYAPAFKAIFNQSENLKDKSYSDSLSNEEIGEAVNVLNDTVKKYSLCVQKYSAGDASEAKMKHQLEQEWGVKQSGRYGFLQCAEVMLAKLAANLTANGQQNSDVTKIRDAMSQLNEKIVSPAFTHDIRKLKPLLSFTNLLSISNHSHTVTAELNLGLGNDTVHGGGKVSIATIHKRVNNPYRIRAGEQRDIEITLTGNITLSNLLSKLTQDIADSAGIPLSALHSSVKDAFSSTTSLSQGVKIIVRYFSPDWSVKEDGKRKYSHQVTYVQSIADSSMTTNIDSPSAIISGGINLNLGTSRTDVAVQKMGTDTLNYLMLRYNYLCDKPQDQPVWERFIQENRSNLLALMKNIGIDGTNSHQEVNSIFLEKFNKSRPLESIIRDKFADIMGDLSSATADEDSFDKGLTALITLMKWHKETTDMLFKTSLTPSGIAKPQLNVVQKAMSPFRKN